jgi:ATP-binding cassette, subfamily F, member 3
MKQNGNLFQLQNGSKQFGDKILFDRAQFSINQNEHVGVIGPNGAGKTTLFKIITDREHLDSGEVIKMQGLRIGYLEQESDWKISQTSEDYLAENCSKPIWELKQLGLNLGLTQAHFQSPLANLSGGFRMRMKLLEILGQEPDLMLLDEPTNFLDLESILVLEVFLQNYDGAFLLISHDREFLRRTTEYTLEVEGGEIVKYPGHIDDYFDYKSEIVQIKQQQAANLEVKRKHLQDFVDRFRAKATKARQAQSRMKQLNKMETIEIKALPLRSRIHLPTPWITGKEVLQMDTADLGYESITGPKKILKNVNLIIERGQKVGVVGYNGAGKSTLLKTLSGKIPLLNGDFKLGYKVELSYFAQHLTEELLLEDTVLDSLQRKTYKDTLHQEILSIAGSLLFSGDELHKKVKVLSGGEKTRVALGQMLLQKKPLLIMDEPTNHLDFDTVNALSDALSRFEGTLIVVSHDRSFIKRVSNRILEIKDGTAELYPGTYDDYLWSLEKGSLSQRLGQANEQSRSEANVDDEQEKKFNYKEVTKKLASEIKELQRKILKTEELIFAATKEMNLLNGELLAATGQKAQQVAISIAEKSRRIEDSETILLTHMESLDEKEKELLSLKDN